MKKYTIQLLCVLLSTITLNTLAQSAFKQEWKSEFPVKVESRVINDDRTLVLGGNSYELAMMDAVTGKILWVLNVKEKTGQKKSKDWNFDKKVGVVWLDVKGDKKDDVKTYYYDAKSGNEITEAAYKELRANYESGLKWVYRGTLEIPSHQTDVWLDYTPKKIVGSAGKGTKGDITVKAKGNNTWSTTIQAKYIRTLCSNAIPRSARAFGGDFLRLAYAQNKVFVIYEGMSVLDVTTGKLLWQIDLDNTDFDFGVFKSVQTLGRAGYPYADETGVYVADLTKGQYCIKKYDLTTGQVLWQSEKFDKDDVVPSIEMLNGVLVVQFGGRLITQTYVPGVEGRPDVCKSEYKFAGNAGVRAYDPASGKLLWQTDQMKELGDKFNGGITNLVVTSGAAYVASDKNVYAFTAEGKLKFSVPIKSLKIGKPVELEIYSDGNLLVQAEEGIASIQPNDGKVNFATNTDKCLSTDQIGEAYYIWVGKDQFEMLDFVRIDMKTGQILGKMKDTKFPYFSVDGNYFVKFDGVKVMRYITK